ncbi:DUF3563 family protein [Microvirga sp. 2TAF3]|uniref:DUF3563 family protein n=1 Tax=Microvirga sp. 2TAF3 TaxID=3233014 RepID=UPI003F9D667C
MIQLLMMTSTKIAVALRDVRRYLGILTEQEARLAYLEQAQDRVDLEWRMRELDRPRRTVSFPGNNWNL